MVLCTGEAARSLVGRRAPLGYLRGWSLHYGECDVWQRYDENLLKNQHENWNGEGKVKLSGLRGQIHPRVENCIRNSYIRDEKRQPTLLPPNDLQKFDQQQNMVEKNSVM